MIKFLTSKIKILKKLNIPFLLYLSSKYNYKLKINKYAYKSYFDLKLKFIRYICYNYCITFKQYLYYLKKIKGYNENNLYFKLLNILESRLDVFLVNIGFFKTILQSRYYIKYKYVYMNNIYCNYYNIKLKSNDIIFFNNKIKYIILYNLIYRYNIYIYISSLYKYNFIKSYSFNEYFIICIYNLKIKILNNLYLNNILYIYNNIYNI
ncbi:apicoplast ribosomal protein S4 [Plasmodium chabaudi chabaudi]|uniref:Apicoplast ribosomal protein S4 n=3 Tax=Plasmodium chabaudi TaxID=5825 RepID=R4ZCV3_PLACU|nr:small subunit ribosomal protein 4 (Rps4) [Plasmodium chabaudi chabaudi]SCL95190.1 apicoplast ribosomal protein S4 [Plasmodium chabaudi adami]BAL70708.1 small subunit ribosomal protein 4 [Plasmodium chabaudi]CCP24616.1 small subunit ribosomal protein 4 (Rps4) [Plasmodium chabaudi chabaudi]CCP24647.1 small subunit ribosomal protein 4 (Rps4) [Plasmodium chabaudi chabaudi]CDR17336.1 apicoplast ribosomal protein S4 [Plasmodium chabaudi chabaudi]|eukprot:YP_009272504.1 small subunit ribosomal protein 4 (Rps4) (apicoplast) [Plasmodium chabaudi chabaudi]